MLEIMVRSWSEKIQKQGTKRGKRTGVDPPLVIANASITFRASKVPVYFQKPSAQSKRPKFGGGNQRKTTRDR